MGPEMIIAMVASAMITNGWQTGQRRSRAAWAAAHQQARQRAQKRAKQRADRYRTARRAGPRDPLWWAYATGWAAGAAVRASGAAVRGAAEGGVAGARSGYRFGQAGRRAGRGFRATWSRWRAAHPRSGGPHQTTGTRRCTSCGVFTTERLRWGRCPDCRARPHPEPNQASEQAGPAQDAGHDTHRVTEPDPPTPGQAEPVTAQTVVLDRPEPDQHEPTQQNQTTASEAPTMTALPAAPTGTGEGYTDAIETLQTLASQLEAANETAQQLGEHLEAAELDADTIGRISDLMDALDGAAPTAQQAAAHIEQRHAPLADAVAGAGGSPNVARPDWYDQH